MYKQCPTGLSAPARLGQGGRTTIPELDQPLMVVVVLIMVARAATPARVAGAEFRANGRAANMGSHCSRCARTVGSSGHRWRLTADARAPERVPVATKKASRRTPLADQARWAGSLSPAPSPPHPPSAPYPPWWCLRCRCRACADPGPVPSVQPLRCAGRRPPG